MSKQPNSNSVAYWRGTVDTRLENFSSKLDDVCIRISNVEAIVIRIEEQLGHEGKFVPWSYIRDKFTVPLILAGIIFLLFTLMPAIFIVVYVILGDTP